MEAIIISEDPQTGETYSLLHWVEQRGNCEKVTKIYGEAKGG